MRSYDDIISLPRWNPRNHTRMPLEKRASQFAPFAALVGHDEAIRETARITEDRAELDSGTARTLNEKVNLLMGLVATRPEIEVTFFVEDANKPGGSYKTHNGTVRAVDETGGEIIFADGRHIPLSSILHITGKIFKDIEGLE